MDQTEMPLVRRWKRIKVSVSLLIEMFKSGRRCFDIREGLPDDAVAVAPVWGVGLPEPWTEGGQFLNIVVASALFPEVPDGDPIPVFRPPLDFTHFPCLCRDAAGGVERRAEDATTGDLQASGSW